MPTIAFCCESCEYEFEEFFFINAERPTSCPRCFSQAPDFHQVFAGQAPQTIIKGSPKTFGQQAELNAQQMGREQMQRMQEEARKRPTFSGTLPQGAKINRERDEITERPWFRDGEFGLKKMDHPLNLNKVKDVKDYVMTGEGAS